MMMKTSKFAMLVAIFFLVAVPQALATGGGGGDGGGDDNASDKTPATTPAKAKSPPKAVFNIDRTKDGYWAAGLSLLMTGELYGPLANSEAIAALKKADQKMAAEFAQMLRDHGAIISQSSSRTRVTAPIPNKKKRIAHAVNKAKTDKKYKDELKELAELGNIEAKQVLEQVDGKGDGSAKRIKAGEKVDKTLSETKPKAAIKTSKSQAVNKVSN